MAFRWLGYTRRGAWTSFRKFILEERRDIQSRIDSIDRQMESLGEILVTYDSNESGESIQKRKKFEVIGNDSSVAKLVKTYISLGGNPLDISMFLNPMDTRLVKTPDDIFFEKTAMGGVVAPMSGSPDQIVFTGGWMEWEKDPKWNLGNAAIEPYKLSWALETIMKSRKWTEKEIRNKRNKLEEKIIKLCDLAEQLQQEKDLLLQKIEGFNETTNLPDVFNLMQTAEYPIALIDSIFWKEAEGEDMPKASNPEERQLTEDMLYLSREEIEANRDIQIRTYHMNFFEETDNQKYPITAL